MVAVLVAAAAGASFGVTLAEPPGRPLLPPVVRVWMLNPTRPAPPAVTAWANDFSRQAAGPRGYAIPAGIRLYDLVRDVAIVRSNDRNRAILATFRQHDYLEHNVPAMEKAIEGNEVLLEKIRRDLDREYGPRPAPPAKK